MGFKSCGPNEAMIISGACHEEPRMVVGGRVFVWPRIQKVRKISLDVLTIQVETKLKNTQGVPVLITCNAEVKINGLSREALLAACENFLGKSSDEVNQIVLENLEGLQKAVVEDTTVEEIYKDKEKVSKSLFEAASSELTNMGMIVISYTLKDIAEQE